VIDHRHIARDLRRVGDRWGGQRDAESRGAETSFGISQLISRMGGREVFSRKYICLGPSGDGLLMAGIHRQLTIVARALS
jgi:hypothetical protein